MLENVSGFFYYFAFPLHKIVNAILSFVEDKIAARKEKDFTQKEVKKSMIMLLN